MTARQSLDVARQMLRYSLEEARRSVMDLRSQALESRDLTGALRDLARQMTLGTPVRAEVRVQGTPRPLDGSQEHHLLRIGLEALTNALKHSGAKRVDIEVALPPRGHRARRYATTGAGSARATTGRAASSAFSASAREWTSSAACSASTACREKAPAFSSRCPSVRTAPHLPHPLQSVTWPKS